MAFRITFHGVRGSIPVSDPHYNKYGGNTSCVSMSCGDTLLVFDGGTGIRHLAQSRPDNTQFFLMISHTHWDHIHSIPFFRPAFNPLCDVVVHAGHLIDKGGIKSALSNQMSQPFFPIPVGFQKGMQSFNDFRAGEEFHINDVKVRTTLLNHPGGSTGYRIEYKGKVACYVTDTEHNPNELDATVIDLIQDADLVIYDSTYADENFSNFIGWGHSTYQEGIRLCQAAGAKQLAIFHHDPDNDDAHLDTIAVKAKGIWKEAFVARERDHIDL